MYTRLINSANEDFPTIFPDIHYFSNINTIAYEVTLDYIYRNNLKYLAP